MLENLETIKKQHMEYNGVMILPDYSTITSIQSVRLRNGLIKGQTISEWIYEVIVSPKIRTKNCQDFCPHYTGQKSWQFFVRILGETMTS